MKWINKLLKNFGLVLIERRVMVSHYAVSSFSTNIGKVKDDAMRRALMKLIRDMEHQRLLQHIELVSDGDNYRAMWVMKPYAREV